MARRTTFRVLVVLSFIRLRASQLADLIIAVANAINGDADVPVPIVPLADMINQGQTLQGTIQARVTDKSKALTQTFNTQVNTVLNSLTYTAGQIEMIANTIGAGDPAVAKEIINRFGFEAKAQGVRPSRIFEVYKLEAPGKAWLRCPRNGSGKTIYLWRYTQTPAQPDSWSDPMQTITSSVALIELETEKRYFFQYAKITNPGRGAVIDVNDPQIAWSDAVSAMIA